VKHASTTDENKLLKKKCMDYEMEGVKPRGGREKTWTEVVKKRLLDMTRKMMLWM